MAYIKRKAIAIAALVALAGCNNFLDQPTPGKIAQSEYYQTEKDAQQATLAIYDRLSASYYSNWASMYVVKTMLSDEGTSGGSNSGDQIGYQNLDDYTTDALNDKVAFVWRQYYAIVQRANAVINNTKDDTDNKKTFIAEAKALRAMAYFDLVAMWGPVPLVTKDVDPSKYMGYPRSSRADIYALIEQDLNDAIDVLPVKSKYSAGDKFRISKGTAQALLGKVYMFESATTDNGGLGANKWADAATLFQAVIDSKEYKLEPSMQRAFSKVGEFGDESLFEISYVSYIYTWANFPWATEPESDIHIQLMGPRGDFYTPIPGDSLLGGWGFNLPVKKMYDAFEVGDGRKKQTLMSEAEFIAAGGKWTGQGSWKYNGYLRRKYGTFSNETTTAAGAVPDLNYGTNVRVIRYADVLLMAAEAYHNAGQDGVALGFLNQVRTRPATGLTALNVSGGALTTAIIHERFVELAYEGMRFQDLIRWGLAAQELPSAYNPAKHNVLPIPYTDVLTSGLEQNPNY